MAKLTGDISNMVFRAVSRDDLGEFSLDGQMLRVVVELDGKKDLAGVARSLNMDLGTMRGVVSRLLELQLVEKAEDALPILNGELFEYLTAQLYSATGPIAEALLEDVAAEMGTLVEKIPYYRAAEFVDYLSREIPDEEKRLSFKQAMIQKMKQMGP